MFELSAV